MTAGIDEQLMAVLVCPDDQGGPLLAGRDGDPDAPALTCPECRREFAVRDGIPVLLPRDADDEE